MRNIKIKILIGIVIFTVIAITLNVYYQKQKDISVINSMTGKIIYGYVTNSNTEHSRGMKLLDIESNKSKYVYDFEFEDSDYNMYAGTVLTLENNEEIHEYGIEDMSDRIILKNTFNKGPIMQLRYVPNDNNNISMQLGNTDKMYLFNLKSKELKETIFNVNGGFCWLDNENIIFSNEGKIYIGNTVTKRIEYLTDGKYPEISNNKKYLAFLPHDKNVLSLYNINSRVVEKTFNSKSNIFNYKFSPDNNNIAIVQEGRKAVFYFDIDLKVINLDTGRKIGLVEGVSSYDFVWIK